MADIDRPHTTFQARAGYRKVAAITATTVAVLVVIALIGKWNCNHSPWHEDIAEVIAGGDLPRPFLIMNCVLGTANVGYSDTLFYRFDEWLLR